MENISVYLRVRPFTESEQNAAIASALQVVSKDQVIAQSSVNGVKDPKFSFKEIFDKNEGQSDVCDAVTAPIIDNILQGYNCTLFAYGSIGSGKSYAMCDGSTSKNSSPSDTASMIATQSIRGFEDCGIGIIPFTINRLFDALHRNNAKFTIRVNYLEVFNEELNDLLASNDANTTPFPLKVYENTKNNALISGLTEKNVNTATEALDAFEMGRKRLKAGIHSTKSHSIFTLMVYIKETHGAIGWDQDTDELLKFCKLHLVQLASNVYTFTNGAGEKQIRAKATQSFASFNRVIQALIDKQNHIPYRDSKLTRILQESLGGNTKTSFIATVAPGANFIDDTVQTLEFMTRVKGICNRPVVNERLSKALMMNDITRQINQLKLDIEASQTKTGQLLTEEELNDDQDKLNAGQSKVRENRAAIKLLTEQYAQIESVFDDLDYNLRAQNQKIAHLRQITAIKSNDANKVSHSINVCNQNIDRHVITEKKLTEQALELAKTALELTSDHKDLCEGIERRRMNDKDLYDAFNRFMDEMKSHFNNMTVHTQNNGRLINNFIATSRNNQEKFHRMSLSMLELLKSNTSLIQQKGEIKHSDAENKMCYSVSNIQKDLNGEAAANVSTKSEIFEQFTQLMAKSFAEKEKSSNILRQMILNQLNMMKAFATTIETRGKAFYDSLVSEIRSLSLTLDQCIEMNRKVTEHMSKVIDQIQVMVEKVEENNRKLPTLVQPSLDAIEEHVRVSNEQTIKSIKSFSEDMDSIKLKPLSGNYADDFNSKAIEIKRNFEQTDESVANVLKMVSAANASTSNAMKQHVENMSEDLLPMCNKLGTSESVNCLTASLNAYSIEATKQNEDNFDLVNTIIETNEEFSENHKREIASSRNELKFFQNIDYCPYSPTGGTPSKRDYATNVELAATTPHDKLKQRFRDRITQNGGISPSINDLSFLRN